MSRLHNIQKIIDSQIDRSPEIRILDKNANVDINCGIDVRIITAEKIEQLEQGKVGFFDDGEYTHIICLEKSQTSKEMAKLRNMLDEQHIYWVDVPTYGKFGVERTHFEHQGRHYSVIHGFGSYGGYYDYKDKSDDMGLLELMISEEMPKSSLTVGYLTAEEVMNYVLGGKENG